MSETTGAAAQAKRTRPLSPHLQVYRPQLTSVLSIFHRMTGVGLGFGAVLLVLWLCAAAQGGDSYIAMQEFLGSWPGMVLLLGWSWALFYHLCTGIRHLIWDLGKGLDLPFVYASGYAALLASAGLTVLSWIVAFILMP